MTWYELVVLGLATWRLTSFLSNEQGPAGICEKFRSFAGLKFERGQDIPKNFFASDLTCQWCTSIYAGVFWSVLYLINKNIAFALALPFALSTIAILVMTKKEIQIFLRHMSDK